jgi:hypothetical protein
VLLFYNLEVQVGEVTCPPISCFSYFLAGPEISPLLLLSSFTTQLPKGISPFLCGFFFPLLKQCLSKTATSNYMHELPGLFVLGIDASFQQ